MVTIQGLVKNPFTLCIAKNAAQITRTASALTLWSGENGHPFCLLNFNASHQLDDAVQDVGLRQNKIETIPGSLLKLLMQDNKHRLLIIDCHDSQSALVESLNSMFDDDPYLQISPRERKNLRLEKAKVVLLVTEQDVEEGKFSEAFYSRLSHVKLDQNDFTKTSPSQKYWPEEMSASKHKLKHDDGVKVDLGYANDWQTPLWGQFVAQNAQWRFQPGRLREVTNKSNKTGICVLYNTPSPLPKDLRYFIDSAKAQTMTVYGESLDLRQVTFVNGGHLGTASIPKSKHYQYEVNTKKTYFPVNPVTVEALLQTTAVDSDGYLQTKAGLLSQSSKQDLLISANLSRSQWHRLSTKAADHTLHVGKDVKWRADYLGKPPEMNVKLPATQDIWWRGNRIESIKYLRTDAQPTVVFYCHDLGLGTALLHDCAARIDAKISWIYTVNEDKDDGQLLSRYAGRKQDKKAHDEKDGEKANVDTSPNTTLIPQRFQHVHGPLLEQLLKADKENGILLLKAADLAPGLLELLEVIVHQDKVLVEDQLLPIKKRLWLLFEEGVTHPALLHAPQSYRLLVDKPERVYPLLLSGSDRKKVKSPSPTVPVKTLLDLVKRLNTQVPKHTNLTTPIHLSWQRLHALYRELLIGHQDIHEAVDRLIWGHFYGQDPEARAYARVLLKAALPSPPAEHTVDITVLTQVLKTCHDLSKFDDVFWRLLLSLNTTCLQTLNLNGAPIQGEGLERARQYLRALLSHYNGRDFSTRQPVSIGPSKDTKSHNKRTKNENRQRKKQPNNKKLKPSTFSLAAACREYALVCGVTDWPTMPGYRHGGNQDEEKRNVDDVPVYHPRVTKSQPLDTWTQQTRTALKLIQRYPAVALIGPAGTGKSHFLRKLAEFANDEAGKNQTKPKIRNKKIQESKPQINVQLFGPLNISPQTRASNKDFKAVVEHWLGNRFEPRNEPNTWYVLALDEANLRDQRLWNLWRDISQETPLVWWEGSKRVLESGHKIVVTGNPPDYVGRLQGRVMRDLFFTVYFHPFDAAYLETHILPNLLTHYGIDHKNLADISTNLAAGIEACRILRPRQDVSVRDIQSILQTCKAIDPKFNGSRDVLYQAWVRAVFAGFGASERKALMTWYRQHHFQEFNSVIQPTRQVLPFAQEAKEKLANLKNEVTVTSLTREYVKLVIACIKDIEYLTAGSNKDKAPTARIGKFMGIFEGPSGIGKDLILPRILEQSGYKLLKTQPDAVDGARYYRQITASTIEKLVSVVNDAKHKGYAVVVSEINLLPSAELEGVLNDILAGAATAGFYLFVTMNSSRLSGRQTLSRAFMNRGVVCRLRTYHGKELLQILNNDQYGRMLNQDVAVYLVNLHRKLQAQLQKKATAPLPTLRELKKCAKLVAQNQKGTTKKNNLATQIRPFFTKVYWLYETAAAGIKGPSQAKLMFAPSTREDATPASPDLSHLVQIYSQGFCQQLKRKTTASATGEYDQRLGVSLSTDKKHDVLGAYFQGNLARYTSHLPPTDNPYRSLLLRAWWLGLQKKDLARQYQALNKAWWDPLALLRGTTTSQDIKGDEKDDNKDDEKKQRGSGLPRASPELYGDLLCSVLLSRNPLDTLSKLTQQNNTKDLPKDRVNCLKQVKMTHDIFQDAREGFNQVTTGPIREALTLAFLQRWADLTRACFDENARNLIKLRRESLKISAFTKQYQYAVVFAHKAPLGDRAQRGIEGCAYLASRRLAKVAPETYLDWWRRYEPGSELPSNPPVEILNEQQNTAFELWLDLQFSTVQADQLRQTLTMQGSLGQNPQAQHRVAAFVYLLTQGRCRKITLFPKDHTQTLIPDMFYSRESNEFFLLSDKDPEWCTNLLLATAVARWSYELPDQTDPYRRRLTETLHYLIYTRQILQSYPGYRWPPLQERVIRKNKKSKRGGVGGLVSQGTLQRHWRIMTGRFNQHTEYDRVPKDILIYWVIKTGIEATKDNYHLQAYVQKKIKTRELVQALLTAWAFGYIDESHLITAATEQKWWTTLRKVTNIILQFHHNYLNELSKPNRIDPSQIDKGIQDIAEGVGFIYKELKNISPKRQINLQLHVSSYSGNEPSIPVRLATNITGNIKYLAIGIINQCNENGEPDTGRHLTKDDFVSAADPKGLKRIGRITVFEHRSSNNKGVFKFLIPLGCAINSTALKGHHKRTLDLTDLFDNDGLITFESAVKRHQYTYDVWRPIKPRSETPEIVKCNHRTKLKIDTTTGLGRTLNKIVSGLPEDQTRLTNVHIPKIRELERWIARNGDYSDSGNTPASWKRWHETNETQKPHMLNFCLQLDFKGVCYQFNSILFAILWSLKRYKNPMRMLSIYRVKAGEVYTNNGHIVVDVYIEGRWVRFDATPSDPQIVDHADKAIQFAPSPYPYAPPDRKVLYDKSNMNGKIQNVIRNSFSQLFHMNSTGGGTRFVWSGHRLNVKQLIKNRPPFEVPSQITTLKPQNLVITTHKVVTYIAGRHEILSADNGSRFYWGHAINHLFTQLFRLGFSISVSVSDNVVNVKDIDQLRYLMYAGNICDITPEQVNKLRETKRLIEPFCLVDEDLIRSMVESVREEYMVAYWTKFDEKHYHLQLQQMYARRVLTLQGHKPISKETYKGGSILLELQPGYGSLPEDMFTVQQPVPNLRVLGIKHFNDITPKKASVSNKILRSLPLLESIRVAASYFHTREFFATLDGISLYCLVLNANKIANVDVFNSYLQKSPLLYVLVLTAESIASPLIIPPNIKYLSIDLPRKIDFRYNRIVTLAVRDVDFSNILSIQGTFPELVTLSLLCIRFPGHMDPNQWEEFKARCPKLTRFKVIDGHNTDTDEVKNHQLVAQTKYKFTGITHVLYTYSKLTAEKIYEDEEKVEERLQAKEKLLKRNAFPDAIYWTRGVHHNRKKNDKD